MLFKVSVDGERFDVRKTGSRYDYVWLNGKNPGYGFTTVLSEDIPLSEQQLRDSILSFLSDVDPESSVTHMTETKQRSLLERLIGKPSPWLAWAWAALAVLWIVIAVVDLSGFHTFMAIAWTVLAAVQLGSVYYARRQEQNRAQRADTNSASH
jgi:hypothetical protein